MRLCCKFAASVGIGHILWMKRGFLFDENSLGCPYCQLNLVVSALKNWLSLLKLFRKMGIC